MLTVYQALIRAAADAVADQPRLDMDRLSFTVLLQTAADTVTRASGITPNGPTDLVGAIGRAALAALWPARRRRRTKARSKKNATSKYQPNYGKHPQQAQHYTIHTQIHIMEEGLSPRQ